MAGFSNVVCTKELVIGPKCRQKVYEDAEPRQKDCLENAKLYHLGEFAVCFGNIHAGLNVFPTYNPCGGEIEQAASTPASYANCLYNLDMSLPSRCFCGGLAGNVCTTCLPEPPEEEAPPSNDPDVTTETVTQKTLPQISVPHSDYGLPLPKIFGTISVAGNICWLGDARITTKTTRVVAGNTVTVTQEEIGTCDFMVGVCVGEIGAIARIWLNDVLVYNNTSGELDPSIAVNNQELYDLGFTVDIWKGNDAQRVNPTMSGNDGFGRTPAYRDMCYLLFNNYPLTFSDANLPAVTVEVMNDIDTSVRVFESTDLDVVSPSVFGVDPTALQVVVSDGNWVDLLDMSSTIVTEVDNVIGAQITDQGDFLLKPDDDTIKVVSGRVRQESATMALETDGGFMSTITINGVTKIVLARGDDITVVDWIVDTLTLEESDSFSAVTTGTLVASLADNFSYGENTEADNKFVAIAEETGQLKFIVGDFTNPNTNYVFPFTGNYLDAMVYKANGSIVVWTEEAGNIVVRQLRLAGGNIETLWVSSTPAYTPNVSGARFFQGFKRYDYIADGAIYTMNLETGVVTTLGDMLNAPDASTPLAQFYDGQRGNIIYTTDDGEVCKLYPDVRQDNGANLRQVLEYMDTSIKAPSLSNVVFGGYLLLDQDKAVDALTELKTFFNLTTINNGNEIKIAPISGSNIVAVDVARETLDVVETRGQVPDDLTGIAITYFGGDSGQDTQVVRRDVLAGFDDYVANIEDETFVIPINTTPLIARRSAERQLIRRLQRQSTVELTAAPSLLTLEPGDYLFGDALVTEITLSSSYIGQVESNIDAQDIYTDDPGLDGISSTPGNDPTVYDNKYPLRVFPMLLKLPPTANGLSSDQVYIGLTNPDDTEFEPASVYVRGVGETYTVAPFLLVGEPSKELAIGRLVSAPNYTTRPYTTDYDSVLVIEFYKNVEGRVQNKTVDQLRAGERVNMLFVGDEIMQYTSAEVDIDGKTVSFRGLVRGRFGTVHHTNSHVPGEVCVIYDTDSVLIGDIPVESTNISVVASNGGLSRSINTAFDSFLDDVWEHGGMWIKKSPNGMDDEGVLIRIPGAQPFTSTFRNNSQFPTPEPPVGICVLKAPFDAALFETKFAEGGFETTPFEPVVNTNDYIAYMLYYTGQDGEFGRRYELNELEDAGFTLDGDFHFATFTAVEINLPEKADGPVVGWYFPGGANYDRFRSGLRVNNG